jgi:ADP-ribose pyrophosphatase
MNDYSDLIKKYTHLFSNDNDPFRIITDPIRIKSWQELEKDRLQEMALPVDWSNIGILYEDPYIILLRDLVEFPDKKLSGYARILFRGNLLGGFGIAVLASIDGKILLLRNFRHATRSWNLEIPRGYGEPGITAKENALKELYEETGADCKSIIELGDIHPNSGLEDISAKLYFACLNIVGLCDINEGIERLLLVTVLELEKMISNNEITDSFTIAAYTRAKLRGLL